MTSPAEIARTAKAVLRRAFPKTKWSVTSNCNIDIVWTDDGPELDQVEEVLLAAGCAEPATGWDGNRYLKAQGYSFWFDRHNAAERAAEVEDRERRQREYLDQRLREDEVVAEAHGAKREAMKPASSAPVAPASDPSAFVAFEALRVRVETEVATNTDGQQRPSWAPPLILGEELGKACYVLGYLTDDDKWIGRLWATFATPKRSGQYLRQHISHHPLEGISCRGFQLHAGATRGPTHQILFEA